MNEPERHYDRMAEVSLALVETINGERAETTIINGEEFDNRAWLEAEHAALRDKVQDIEGTVTIGGEFAGLEDL